MEALAQCADRTAKRSSVVTSSYPEDFLSLATWARTNGLTGEEGRIRLAQFAILCCIASDGAMRDCLVFKGGNALDFVWFPNRSTRDLDFSLNRKTANLLADAELIRSALHTAMQRPPREHQVVLKLQSFRQEPSRPDASFATFRASVGYAFIDEPRLRLALESGRAGTKVIPLDISTNEEVCACAPVSLGDRRSLLVSTLEDVVAEKLRALLQQQVRNRTRGQDLLDIAAMWGEGASLDLNIVSDYLLRKAAARGIEARKRSFRDPELARRAAQGYGGFRDTTRVTFVEFAAALEALQSLVARLHIPD